MRLSKFIKLPYHGYKLIRNFIFCNVKLGKGNWDKSWVFHKLPLIRKHKDAKIKIGLNFVACSHPKKKFHWCVSTGQVIRLKK
jgi:hypothetical protein